MEHGDIKEVGNHRSFWQRAVTMQPCITASLQQRTLDRLFGTKDSVPVIKSGYKGQEGLSFLLSLIVRPETVLTHCLFLIFQLRIGDNLVQHPDTMQRITMEVTTMVMAKVWEP